jgi:hypothetical protein
MEYMLMVQHPDPHKDVSDVQVYTKFRLLGKIEENGWTLQGAHPIEKIIFIPVITDKKIDK